MRRSLWPACALAGWLVGCGGDEGSSPAGTAGSGGAAGSSGIGGAAGSNGIGGTAGAAGSTPACDPTIYAAGQPCAATDVCPLASDREWSCVGGTFALGLPVEGGAPPPSCDLAGKWPLVSDPGTPGACGNGPIGKIELWIDDRGTLMIAPGQWLSADEDGVVLSDAPLA